MKIQSYQSIFILQPYISLWHRMCVAMIETNLQQKHWNDRDLCLAVPGVRILFSIENITLLYDYNTYQLLRHHFGIRDHSKYGLGQWEEALPHNTLSYWQNPYSEWSLSITNQGFHNIYSMQRQKYHKVLLQQIEIWHDVAWALPWIMTSEFWWDLNVTF